MGRNRFVGAALLLGSTGAMGLAACTSGQNAAPPGPGDGGVTPLDATTPVPDAGPPADSAPSGDSSAPTADGGADASDAAVAACDPAKPFGTPTLAPYPSSALDDYSARLSADQLTMYLMSNRGGGYYQIFTLTRATAADPFTSPTLLPNVNFANANTSKPSVTADGLTLYVESDTDLDGGQGAAARLYSFTRSTPGGTFTGGGLLDLGQSTGSDFAPFVTADGSLYFSSDRAGTIDGYVGKAGASDAGATAIAPINLSGEITLNLTPSTDGLTLYFASNRPDAQYRGGNDIWVSRRAATSDPFGAPSIVNELNTAGNDEPSWLSPDGCTLLFASAGAPADAGPNDGRARIFQATRGK